MTWKHGAGVLYICAALDRGFQQIPKLSGGVDDDREEHQLPQRLLDVQHHTATVGERIADPEDASCHEHRAG